jgi:hypothetical protein
VRRGGDLRAQPQKEQVQGLPADGGLVRAGQKSVDSVRGRLGVVVPRMESHVYIYLGDHTESSRLHFSLMLQVQITTTTNVYVHVWHDRAEGCAAPARVTMSDITCYSLAGTDSLLVLLVQKLC